MLTVKEVFSRICLLLNKHNVDYIVIGGMAVIYHGFPRSTADIDLWYNPTVDNYLRIIKAFEEFGVDVTELKQIVFDSKKTFLRLPVAGVRVEFLPEIPGISPYSMVRGRAISTTIEDIDVKILSYDDLIVNKNATNRAKDKFDIEELEKRKKKLND